MRVFLLGVDDPEMRRIAQILQKAGEVILQAAAQNQPVGSGNAYQADTPNLPKGTRVMVCVECRPLSVPPELEVKVVDHHRPGDPGYDMPPERYWEASSLGQIHHLLGVEPGPQDLVLAAMDHCFPAALRGKCPGVTVDEVLQLKKQEIVLQIGVEAAVLDRLVGMFRQELRDAPELTVLGPVKDMRERSPPLGPGYTLGFLALQFAVLYENAAALLLHRDERNGRRKVMLTGHVSPEQVEYFLKTWALAQGLVRLYGVPARGYAGGYFE